MLRIVEWYIYLVKDYPEADSSRLLHFYEELISTIKSTDNDKKGFFEEKLAIMLKD